MKRNLGKILLIFFGLVFKISIGFILIFFILACVNLSVEIPNLKSEIIRYTEKLENEKEYSLFKQATLEIGSRPYNFEKYNCVDFSKDLVRELEEVGIKSNIAISKDRTHAWVLVWIEATTGKFIPPEKDLGILEIRDENLNVICK